LSLYADYLDWYNRDLLDVGMMQAVTERAADSWLAYGEMDNATEAEAY
jgi:hypothetical protein